MDPGASPGPGRCTRGDSQDHTPGPHEAAEEAHEPEEHHKNALAVFLGGTHAEDQTQGTLGLEYERHLARRVAGLGSRVVVNARMHEPA